MICNRQILTLIAIILTAGFITPTRTTWGSIP